MNNSSSANCSLLTFSSSSISQRVEEGRRPTVPPHFDDSWTREMLARRSAEERRDARRCSAIRNETCRRGAWCRKHGSINSKEN